jgi:colanic acid biosynthesis glycosyl transferase WcaI
VHIAFFNRSYYPDNTATGQLLTDLAEDLVRDHGCQVTVVTGPPLMPTTAVPAPKAIVTRDSHQGVTIYRARGTTFDKKRFAGRAANYVSYFASACWAGLRLDRPDVVVALTDPPIIGLAALLAARRFRAPFVMSYRDLFPEVTVLLDDFHSPAINGTLQRVNQFLCRHAARIVALGDTMQRRLIENKGADPNRTVIIPDWADTTAITPGPRANAFRTAHGLDGKFVVMHSGNIGLSQSLETVIDAAELLRDTTHIQIVFQGDGVRKAELQSRAAARKLSNVTFLPFQRKDRLSESLASADVFIVSLQKGLAGYIVPSKLYGILAAGRPYVAAVEDDCEVAALTRAAQCGLVAEPGNARDLADRILTFHGDRAFADRAGIHARTAALQFDRTMLVSRYMDLFRSLVRVAPVPAAVKAARQVSS